MRSVTIATFTIVLVLVAGLAVAQQCGCPVPAPTCPCSRPCQPAGIGAGPVYCLQGLTGADFDKMFIATMYQQHNDIAALATLGFQVLTDPVLRQLSGKVLYEQTKQNQKLAELFQCMGFGTLSAQYGRIESVVNPIACVRPDCFNLDYAKRMAALLSQSVDAANLGLERTTMTQLRDQAQIVAVSAEKDKLAFERWVNLNTGPSPQGSVPTYGPTYAPSYGPRCGPCGPTY